MPVARIHGGNLYYETHGAGPALIFAHGRGGNHASWWQQIPHFQDRYTCVVYDAPGFGHSEHPDGDWNYVDTLAALIDHLGVADVRLVAQSMGGLACLGYALRAPERVRALVMASTTGSLDLPDFPAIREVHQARAQEVAARGIRTACGERMLREQPALYFLYQQIGSFNRGGWTSYYPPGGERVPPVFSHDLHRLRVPTLYLTGEEDLVWPPEMLAAAANLTPSSRLIRVPQAGHSVYFERPDQFNALVDTFLRGIAPG